MKEPNINDTAFSCPHCGAYTSQQWFYGKPSEVKHNNKRTPLIPNPQNYKWVSENIIDKEMKLKFNKLLDTLSSKQLFQSSSAHEYSSTLHNLFLSQCFNCKKWAVWVHEDLLYPPKKAGAQPNQDLPDSILDVVEEARSIIDLSARGACALLRLSIQMLCKELGETGKDLNNDISNLVTNGLSMKVQQSLDIVRVIGNEAVHPGVIDIDDNKDIALRLFDLINIIADVMITQPKHVNEIYGKLPESKREAIEERDNKTSKSNKNDKT